MNAETRKAIKELEVEENLELIEQELDDCKTAAEDGIDTEQDRDNLATLVFNARRSLEALENGLNEIEY